jgi:hypothetical protein
MQKYEYDFFVFNTHAIKKLIVDFYSTEKLANEKSGSVQYGEISQWKEWICTVQRNQPIKEWISTVRRNYPMKGVDLYRTEELANEKSRSVEYRGDSQWKSWSAQYVGISQ